jgi:3-hydroxyacyl-[acyl-carrier-protein] dehydratase
MTETLAKTTKDSKYALEFDQIQKYLPHRIPFLMVDRILSILPKGDLSVLRGGPDKIGVEIVGIKNISGNDPVFQGHFPGFAIFPGVLIVEAMAQVSSFALYPYMLGDLDRLSRDFKLILVGTDQVRFRKPVLPGDQLRIESRVVKCRGSLWGFEVKALVEGKVVAEGELLANLILKDEAA